MLSPCSGRNRTLVVSFPGHTADSLWSVDLFHCESIVLRSYWVLAVMDRFTRRLVGVGMHRGTFTGVDVCRMSTPPSIIRAHRVTSAPIMIPCSRRTAGG